MKTQDWPSKRLFAFTSSQIMGNENFQLQNRKIKDHWSTLLNLKTGFQTGLNDCLVGLGHQDWSNKNDPVEGLLTENYLSSSSINFYPKCLF